MPSFPPVQAVVRAIELLQALNRQPVSTLDVLHKQTGIPKPSLIRLLETLASKGLVRHAPQYGAYYLTSLVNTLSSGYHSEPRIVEAARPRLDALTEDIKWPVAIAVPDANAMVVRYSTIPNSPLSLLHSTINMRLSLVSRAIGRAYLSFCEDDERETILALLRESKSPEDGPARDAEAVRKMIAQTRAQGYALRDPAVRPVSGTLAVPVYDGKHVVASFGMTWFASTLSNEQVVGRYLAKLLAVSAAITQDLAAL
ncbi:Pca regulon regulatory protein [Pigmentiphaga humi]|uniref:Pca regulon regulatory protein n=1 Tax=Pigmentiphaga humi TaxID=2478468 RepID=A0A3P4B325_9BURK|nr:DNA-binding transcriptional regulator [Pigmentiphaga humi]VCU70462.1 Pca regulon regulatory protein [Pigmentiphaga humi]